MSTSFSIIIPVYNGASHLKECLESVSSQSYEDFEVIVVNDGSTDRSQKIVQNWINEHPSIDVSLINQENRGLGAARNVGIKKAQGTWVCLLDADDKFVSTKLSTLSNFIGGTEVDFIYHRAINFNQVGSGKTRFIYQISTARDLLVKGNPIVPSTTCIRHSILSDYLFSERRDFHGVEDVDLWYRLLKAGYLPRLLEGESLTYYRDEGGMSSNLEEHVNFFKNWIKEMNATSHLSDAETMEAIRRKHYEAARWLQKKARHQEAREHYALAKPLGVKASFLSTLNLLRIAT